MAAVSLVKLIKAKTCNKAIEMSQAFYGAYCTSLLFVHILIVSQKLTFLSKYAKYTLFPTSAQKAPVYLKHTWCTDSREVGYTAGLLWEVWLACFHCNRHESSVTAATVQYLTTTIKDRNVKSGDVKFDVGLLGHEHSLPSSGHFHTLQHYTLTYYPYRCYCNFKW